MVVGLEPARLYIRALTEIITGAYMNTRCSVMSVWVQSYVVFVSRQQHSSRDLIGIVHTPRPRTVYVPLS